ncbi:MAG: hypothetical protein AAGF11_43725 [Myxococcota bacterium]
MITPSTPWSIEESTTHAWPETEGWVLPPRLGSAGTQITLMGVDGPEALAVVTAAVDSPFAEHTGLPETALRNCAWVESLWVSATHASTDLLPAIVYLALRRARILGFSNVVMLAPTPDRGLRALMDLRPLTRVGKIQPQALAGRLKRAIVRAYDACGEDLCELLRAHFIDEILETHRRWMDRFFSGSWTTAVRTGAITQEQYTCTLQNLHHYVRQTTRLAARGIAYAPDDTLRDHYIHHLRGEVNHEILIERDLGRLGEDVDYVKHVRVADPATAEFMVVQQSAIGFDRDPLLLLACPMAAEGISAHMGPEIMDALHQTIARWGIDEPRRVTTFLSSHIHTDGGDDGHWHAVVETVRKSLRDEAHLQRFLGVLTAACNGFEHGFNANIDELRLWSALPEPRA